MSRFFAVAQMLTLTPSPAVGVRPHLVSPERGSFVIQDHGATRRVGHDAPSRP
jgi:hypothetical protein